MLGKYQVITQLVASGVDLFSYEAKRERREVERKEEVRSTCATSNPVCNHDVPISCRPL
jgi:hypothetical protein